MPNRLINESSPYLQQHAYNPVDWYTWGEEALEKARQDDKPILLSVGYSACHWCHVMERESFENEDIARLMNENFVSIKVDREERPDIDSIYMSAVQALTGRGGWPMTVFLTPEGKPFYGGTYFPPEDRHGMPAFPRVLQAMADAYKNRRSEVTEASENLVQQVQKMSSLQKGRDPLADDVLHRAYAALAPQFDSQHGGFGQAPKFPQPMVYEFLLRYHHRTKNEDALKMIEVTLEKMAHGGMYDQIGGGFHRYSTDAHWLVPHFEKMLYDNALLARLFLHVYQVTGKPMYRRIVEETLDYVLREMTSPEGGFYSAQDADSEGVEGRYFVWRSDEIKEVLGEKDSQLICRYYGVTEQGNFEASNILHIAPDPLLSHSEDPGLPGDEESSTPLSADPEPACHWPVGVEWPESATNLDTLITKTKARLLEHRQKRVAPSRDDKILTAWNGLMLRSFAEAAATLNSPTYLAAARNNAHFLLSSLRRDGRLLRAYKDGKAKLKAYLEDYASLIDGLLVIHGATLEPRWLEEAVSLGESMIDLFWDERKETFYDTGSDHEALIIRPKDTFDNALPSGSSAAVDVMLRLAIVTGDRTYSERASTALRAMREPMARVPTGLSHWLCALDFHLSAPKEIAIIGEPNNAATKSLISEVHRRFLPNKVVIGGSPQDTAIFGSIPLLQGRGDVDGNPAAYVCENYACQMPLTKHEDLAQQLSV